MNTAATATPTKIIGPRHVLFIAAVTAAYECMSTEGHDIYFPTLRRHLEKSGGVRNFEDTIKELEKTFRLAGLPVNGTASQPAAPQPQSNPHQGTLADEEFISDFLGEDFGAIPVPVAAPASNNERALLRKVSDRVDSPFLTNGEILMLVPFKELGKGFILTARFNVEGEANQYNIMAKCKGSQTTLQKEGENVRLFEDDRPVTVNKDFETVWKGKKVKGALWLNAVHLPVGREFTVWLNNGSRSNGDLVKRCYKVKQDGSLSVSNLI